MVIENEVRVNNQYHTCLIAEVAWLTVEAVLHAGSALYVPIVVERALNGGQALQTVVAQRTWVQHGITCWNIKQHI